MLTLKALYQPEHTFVMGEEIINALRYGCPEKLSIAKILSISQMLGWFYLNYDPDYGVAMCPEIFQRRLGASEKFAKELRKDMIRLRLIKPAGLDDRKRRIFHAGEALQDGSLKRWVREGAREAEQAAKARSEAREARLRGLGESRAKEQALLDEVMGY